MKKRTGFKKTMAILLVFTSLPCMAGAEEKIASAHLLAGAGRGGTPFSSNVSAEAGGTTTGLDHDIIYGFGAASILIGESIPSGTREWECPDCCFTSYGKRRKDNSYSVHFKLGAEPVPDSDFFVFGIGGLRWTKEIELVRSDSTGVFYENSRKNRWEGLFGFGAGWFPERPLPSVQLSWDRARGVSLLAGISW